MALKLVKEAKKASEGSVSETEGVESFKWADKTPEQRREALSEAEDNYNANLDATDLKVDEAVAEGFIDEETAQDIIAQQVAYLNWIRFNKPITKIAPLETKMYGAPVEEIEVSETVKGLLRTVREKTYYCSLLCLKMDNINNVDAEITPAMKERRAKAREMAPELEADYYKNVPDTSDREVMKKGRGRGRKRK